MLKIVEQFIQLFTKHPTALEQFVTNKAPTSHAEAEYWQKYFEYNGL